MLTSKQHFNFSIKKILTFTFKKGEKYGTLNFWGKCPKFTLIYTKIRYGRQIVSIFYLGFKVYKYEFKEFSEIFLENYNF